ncbi:MAG: NAD(P)H-dependent oxidoreductase subunit E [Gemmatimonadota bacterium]|nr:MAG: NAD(P)H-dependent oxidoreductase subunit E [Gemmatimonadota bacterium]
MSLIGELHRLQEERGYLRNEDLRELAERLRVPLYRIEEVVSFYTHFRTSPAARTEVAVCRDLSCHLLEGRDYCSRVRELLGGDDEVDLHEVSCLGRCEFAPAALVNGVPVGRVSPEELAYYTRAPERLPPARSVHTRRWRVDYCGESGEKYSIYSDYRDRSDGDAAAEEIIEILKQAGLRGMGGAGFPTGVKWELVRKETAIPKYVICNADESEPGAFKDRVVHEELPHLVIEGMCLAALATGAESGCVYVRNEYEPERKAMQLALDDARARGVLGEHFDIEIFVSPGGYILGEETALLEALEDRRGEPRNKPPYPGQKGLRGQPTVINNVETLAMVPAILRYGADWWKAQGVRGHCGLKFIGVSGHVENPGVFEIRSGRTVAELIQRAGGVKDGRPLKAFAPGGASSSFLPADKVDTKIDFDTIADAGSMLGAAALVVIAEGTDMIETATNVTRFFRNESCGKCVPCRTGTEKVVAMLESILAGKGDGALRDILPALEETLAETSICGLGQVALGPVTSALKYWGSELDAYLARSEGR